MTENATKLTEAEARAIMRVLGKAEGEFAASVSFPIFWIIREGDRRYGARNGTAFALNTGDRLFGVTAAHVLDGWRNDRATKKVVALQMGDLPFDPEGRNRIIAAHPSIDIATFEISADEVQKIGKIVLAGYQSQWPPTAPELDRGKPDIDGIY